MILADNITGARFDYHNALESLYRGKGCGYSMTGTEYSGLEWFENNPLSKPTEEELIAECARLQKKYEDTMYQRQRVIEYPNPMEYVDAYVKGDDEAMQEYIDKCLAVKAKYPKPTGA